MIDPVRKIYNVQLPRTLLHPRAAERTRGDKLATALAPFCSRVKRKSPVHGMNEPTGLDTIVMTYLSTRFLQVHHITIEPEPQSCNHVALSGEN